jgi:cytoskeletal protein CcmA (bactofilin family)
MDTSDIGTSTSSRGRGRRGAATPAQPESTGNVVLGPRDTLRGTLTVHGDVHVEGTVEGEISATGAVTVHTTGTAHAQIAARDIVVDGGLDGSAVAQDLMRIGDSATVTGEVRSARLRVDEGATVNATITMGIAGEAPPARRMEEHEEVSIDVTGTAASQDEESGAYVEASAGSESDDEERTPETSAVNSGSDSDEG